MTKQTRRRSAEEWRRLVAAWERSGASAAAFARRRGLSPSTLSWWRWRLSKMDEASPAPAEVTLVRAEIVEEAEDADLVWELRNRAGDTLRVSGDGALEALPQALAALRLAREGE